MQIHISETRTGNTLGWNTSISTKGLPSVEAQNDMVAIEMIERALKIDIVTVARAFKKAPEMRERFEAAYRLGAPKEVLLGIFKGE